jgi:hypothetical protein
VAGSIYCIQLIEQVAIERDAARQTEIFNSIRFNNLNMRAELNGDRTAREVE